MTAEGIFRLFFAGWGFSHGDEVVNWGMPLCAEPDLYTRSLFPRILAPAGDLLVGALGGLEAGIARALELEPGAGGISVALARNEKLADTEIFFAEAHSEFIPHLYPGRAVVARGPSLPFADGRFDLVLGNLALGTKSADRMLLPEVRRILHAEGHFVGTALLRGSFTELFDILAEVAESNDLPDVRGRLLDARADLWEMDEMLEALQKAGLMLESAGEREHGVFFPHGAAVVADPLIRRILVPNFLSDGATFDGKFWREATRAIDTYFDGLRFCITLRLGVVLVRAGG
jgi:SAM-dependent methyltransferase